MKSFLSQFLCLSLYLCIYFSVKMFNLEKSLFFHTIDTDGENRLFQWSLELHPPLVTWENNFCSDSYSSYPHVYVCVCVCVCVFTCIYCTYCMYYIVCNIYILYGAAAAKSPQSCPTLCDPIDGSPPGSSVPGILQARILEWIAISFSIYIVYLPRSIQTHT